MVAIDVELIIFVLKSYTLNIIIVYHELKFLTI